MASTVCVTSSVFRNSNSTNFITHSDVISPRQRKTTLGSTPPPLSPELDPHQPSPLSASSHVAARVLSHARLAHGSRRLAQRTRSRGSAGPTEERRVGAGAAARDGRMAGLTNRNSPPPPPPTAAGSQTDASGAETNPHRKGQTGGRVGRHS